MNINWKYRNGKKNIPREKQPHNQTISPRMNQSYQRPQNLSKLKNGNVILAKQSMHGTWMIWILLIVENAVFRIKISMKWSKLARNTKMLKKKTNKIKSTINIWINVTVEFPPWTITDPKAKTSEQLKTTMAKNTTNAETTFNVSSATSSQFIKTTTESAKTQNASQTRRSQLWPKWTNRK